MGTQPYIRLYEIIVQHIVPYCLLALAIMLAFVGTVMAFVKIIGYFANKWDL